MVDVMSGFFCCFYVAVACHVDFGDVTFPILQQPQGDGRPPQTSDLCHPIRKVPMNKEVVILIKALLHMTMCLGAIGGEK